MAVKVTRGKRGFFMEDDKGNAMHVQGSPELLDDPESRAALEELMQVASDRLRITVDVGGTGRDSQADKD